jgi:hypothetical protein
MAAPIERRVAARYAFRASPAEISAAAMRLSVIGASGASPGVMRLKEALMHSMVKIIGRLSSLQSLHSSTHPGERVI